jgi:hypothetical protein
MKQNIENARYHLHLAISSLLTGDENGGLSHVQAASAAIRKDIILYRQIVVGSGIDIKPELVDWVHESGTQSSVAVKAFNECKQ